MLNPRLLLLMGLGAATLAFQAPAQEKKPDTKGFDRNEYIKKHDKNGDGKLDDKERQEARKQRQEELIKQYDKNGDGKLDDKERQAARDEFEKSRGRPVGKDNPDKQPVEKKAPEEPKKDAPPAF